MKKKILLVIPTLNQGGAERVVSEFANYWSKIGIDVYLVSLVKSEKFYNIDDNVSYYELGDVITNKLSKIKSVFKTYFKLKSLIKKSSFDVIISFLPQSNALTLLSSFGMKQKVYVSERNSPSTWHDHGKTFTFIKFFLYRYATGFIAQTNDAKKVLLQMYPNSKVEVIANPLKKIKIDVNVKKEKIILNVGRLDKQKGQLDLIEAFYKSNLNDDWKLVILGEGSLRKELENMINHLGIKDRVVMPGSVSNVDEWYQKSSIFVFPSYFEGFPNALVEAMASGLPCISYDCDTGPRDMIKNKENGYLIVVGEIDKLSNIIKKLSEDKILRNRISKQSIKIQKEYNIKKISDKLFNLLYEDKK